jgi:putative FmdB family regulatory protein
VPTNVYRCSDCDHHFEVTQSMSDNPVAACEVCGGPVQRVLFAPAIHFKGSGFHNTDYGTKRRPVGGDGDGSASKTSGGDGAAAGSGSGSDSGGAASSGSESSSSGSSGKTVGLDKV